MALVFLASQVQVTLIDETPDFTMQGLEASIREQIEVVQMPLWTNPAIAARQFWSWAGGTTPDWIVLDNPGLLMQYGLWLRRLRRRWGTRVQFTIHSGVLTSTPRRELMYAAASWMALGVDRLTCVSAYTWRHYRRKYPWLRLRAADVIHNGVIIPEVGEHIRHSPLQVGFVGRLATEKSPELFCRIAALAQARGVDWRFHMFGTGPLAQHMESRYGPVVKFHGHCPDPQAIYSSIDMLVVTSPVENCPYAVLESKSYGIPTVAARVGGLPEIVTSGEDGVLCAQRQEDVFIRAISHIEANYEQFSQGCLANRDRFSYTDSARHLWRPVLGE